MTTTLKLPSRNVSYNQGIESAPLVDIGVFCRFMHDISIKFDNGKWTTTGL